MASVQPSVSSSVAQRGRVPQQPRRRACRSLFGPVDHEELNRDLDAKLREISERDQERWNFNFASGTPLPGEYEWESAAVGATPAFYQESVQAGEKKKRVAAPPHTEAPTRETCARRGAANGVVCSERTRTGKLSCTKRKTSARLTTTTRITDFYIKRKKQGDIKQRESTPQNPTSFLSTEQTPRKRLR